jgi:putative transcription factor
MPCCELCGIESKGCKAAMIDGVKMMLCPNCIKHGEGIKTVAPTPSKVEKYITKKTKTVKPKDVFKKMNKELVSNWPDKIKEARKKKGLSREELGFRIGERTVIISKLENGDLRPSDKMIEKLEKELEITLLEELRDVHAQKDSSYSGSGMTLGDFIKTEK